MQATELNSGRTPDTSNDLEPGDAAQLIPHIIHHLITLQHQPIPTVLTNIAFDSVSKNHYFDSSSQTNNIVKNCRYMAHSFNSEYRPISQTKKTADTEKTFCTSSII